MQSDSTQNAPSPNGKPEKIKCRMGYLIFSPLKLVLFLALGVFMFEIVVMPRIMPKLWFLLGLHRQAAILTDASLMTLFLVAFLYLILYRPLLQLIANYRHQESQLRSNQEQLEEKVLERTIELNEAVRQLEEESIERRKAEKTTQESEERLHQIFDQSEDAILLVSPSDHSIVDANPTAERMFNKDRDSLLSGGFSGLCRTTGGDQLESVFTDIVTESRPGYIERFECRTTEDESRVLSFRGKLINLQEAKIVFAAFRDITSRVLLEEEARKVQARLIHANRMTSLGMLVSSVAHEINNPNSYILINAGLIKKAWTDLEPLLEERFLREGDFPVGQTTWSNARLLLPDAFDGIQEGARRIGEIIDNLKEYGREDGSGRMSHANINDVVRLSTSILNHHISRLTNNFKLELADNLPPVKGSTRQLEQVIINLIQNALQSLANQGCGVHVSTGFDAGRNEVFVRIADEGMGIPKELSSRVMEPFFTTRLENGGTGLGLSICSTIIKDHGGTLEFSSGECCGTTFFVRLPTAESSMDPVQAAGGGEQ